MAQRNISTNGSTGSDDLLDGELTELQRKHEYALIVFMHVLSVFEVPVMILTLIALCFLVKSRPAASVFVGHLILSDLIQVVCMLIKSTLKLFDTTGTYFYSLIAGLYFMACVSFERYLLVSHPVWYKSHQSLKLSCFVSLIVWFVPLIFAEIHPPDINFNGIPLCMACLIPYIIVILCFAGTCRGLSRSISLTALKRKLILGSLFLVLLTYTFLVLPVVIIVFISLNNDDIFKTNALFLKCFYFALLLLYVIPLTDCMLYLFMRPDVGDLMKSVHCCCREHNQDEHSVVNPQNSCSTVVYSTSRSLNTRSSV